MIMEFFSLLNISFVPGPMLSAEDKNVNPFIYFSLVIEMNSCFPRRRKAAGRAGMRHVMHAQKILTGCGMVCNTGSPDIGLGEVTKCVYGLLVGREVEARW